VTSLRVERAIRLLPAVDALEPLRAVLVSTSHADERNRWSSSGPYLTLGKRGVDIDGLRERVGELLPRITAHLTTIYQAYVNALAQWESGDAVAAARALIEGGDAELTVGRIAQAHAWYDVAFHVATELPERSLEIELLDRLGGSSRALSRHSDAARYYQRALVLAEAEFDHESAIRACLGLGHAARDRDQLGGAHAWYVRALRMAESGAYPFWVGQLEHQLGAVAWRQGEVSIARARLQRARDILEPLEHHAELARTLCTLGRVEHSAGLADEGLAALRESLAWARKADDDTLLIDVLMELAAQYAGTGKLLDAENELRRAEQTAIARKQTDRLISVYLAMGQLCGLRRDDTGFVFFEQAIELCHTLSSVTALEGRVYEAYGNFRHQVGDREEARAHLERARQLFEASGDDVSLARLHQKMASLSA
jgi:tetratricopeptide (TPR) repeat protein